MQTSEIVKILRSKTCNSMRATGDCIHPACHLATEAANQLASMSQTVQVQQDQINSLQNNLQQYQLHS